MAKIPRALSKHEENFNITWRVLGGPPATREYEFHPKRCWRFDFAWPDTRVAVEIDGGVNDGPGRGAHSRRKGYAEDCEKLNEAAFMGWTVFRLVPDMITVANVTRIIRAVREGANGGH